MRHAREVLRLGVRRDIQARRRTGAAASAVRETIELFTASDLDWPLPEAVTDSELDDGYRHSRFCELYHAGDKAPGVTNPLTGEIREA
ncbi:hypothetical protein BH10PSE6_BH10PSE6_11640 [soil metagenome]